MAETQTLLDAIRQGQTEAVVAAMKADPGMSATCDEQGIPVALVALYHGHRDLAGRIADLAEPDLHIASALGRMEELESLLAQGPDLAEPSADGWTPLHLACFFGNRAAAHRLLDVGAPLAVTSQNGLANQPLHTAVIGGLDDVVETMLAAGADSGFRAGGGVTPLHLAASRGDDVICDLLLQAGADRTLETAAGETPADLARQRGFPDLAARLA